MLASKLVHDSLCNVVQHNDARFLVLVTHSGNTNTVRLISGVSSSGTRYSLGIA
jgi:hypothetical protein